MAHLSQAGLEQRLGAARSRVEIGRRYCHYKQPGQAYRVVDLVILEEGDAVGVVYRAEYGKNITFVRPLSSWEEVIGEAENAVPRFSPIVE